MYMIVYDWNVIKEDYDKGMSQRDLIRKYGMSSRTLHKAGKKGLIQFRTKIAAGKLYYSTHPPTVHTEEFTEECRIRILKRYEDGWMPKAGRCNKYTYISEIAGTVSLDGTWELQTAQWLDENRLSWRRNTKKFPYYDDSGKLRNYTPDFWIEDWNSYLEVKGYETALDRAKWRYFPYKLLVWKKKELLERNII